MSLNGLAGAGKAKTDILAAKGVHEEPFHGEISFFNGLFGTKKAKPGTRTVIPIKPVASSVEQNKGKEVVQGVAPEKAGQGEKDTEIRSAKP